MNLIKRKIELKLVKSIFLFEILANENLDVLNQNESFSIER